MRALYALGYDGGPDRSFSERERAFCRWAAALLREQGLTAPYLLVRTPGSFLRILACSLDSFLGGDRRRYVLDLPSLGGEGAGCTSGSRGGGGAARLANPSEPSPVFRAVASFDDLLLGGFSGGRSRLPRRAARSSQGVPRLLCGAVCWAGRVRGLFPRRAAPPEGGGEGCRA